MSRIRITKEFNFETAHALYGYDGKCRNIHGHSYHLSVTLIGTPISDPDNTKLGLVMDFGDLKKKVNAAVVDPFDHAMIFNKNSPHFKLAKDLEAQGHKIILTDYQPSSENMVLDFVNRIKQTLPEHIQLHSLKLRETASAYAEWYAADNPESAS